LIDSSKLSTKELLPVHSSNKGINFNTFSSKKELSPIKDSLKELSPIKGFQVDKKDPFVQTVSSMISTSDIGRIDLEKLETKDLEQTRLEYHYSDEDSDYKQVNKSDFLKLSNSPLSLENKISFESSNKDDELIDGFSNVLQTPPKKIIAEVNGDLSENINSNVGRDSEIQTVISKVPQATLDVKSNKNVEYLKVKTLEDTLNTKQLNNEKEIKELEEKLNSELNKAICETKEKFELEKDRKLKSLKDELEFELKKEVDKQEVDLRLKQEVQLDEYEKKNRV